MKFEKVKAEGYGFQIEMTYRTALLGFRIRELPITIDKIIG